ncbi:hypothetical protein O3G_MSEX008493 [Manduca sexta]|uniref:Uncharacterized protein n=1 Tax=Manduca sexta TaxID=7130 RepID=A0A922CQ22_MANSE|nr:hypothetical protein O3G_MSEX008493 [Manduca sexta]KAG6454100.1 hypothetical protein O3G_MSEX008493 [Manduca sexta]KAG6454101.1 hypothetical protein O3G_MSEX008493 [Manduca sexta]KAG6454102.1 hypothetical protein O3G_MSEX008493 [Manduca sexta]
MEFWKPHEISLAPALEEEDERKAKGRKDVGKILNALMSVLPVGDDAMEFAPQFASNIPVIRQTSKRHRLLPTAGRRNHRRRHTRVLGTRRPASIENQYFTLFILTKDGLLNEIRITDKL